MYCVCVLCCGCYASSNSANPNCWACKLPLLEAMFATCSARMCCRRLQPYSHTTAWPHVTTSIGCACKPLSCSGWGAAPCSMECTAAMAFAQQAAALHDGLSNLYMWRVPKTTPDRVLCHASTYLACTAASCTCWTACWCTAGAVICKMDDLCMCSSSTVAATTLFNTPGHTQHTSSAPQIIRGLGWRPLLSVALGTRFPVERFLFPVFSPRRESGRSTLGSQRRTCLYSSRVPMRDSFACYTVRDGEKRAHV
jgi:hypothetical protein